MPAKKVFPYDHPGKFAAAPPSGVDREAVIEQLADLLNNEGCSCAGTPEHPCPRCIVSIEQARELLIKAGWEHELAAARAVPEAKPAARPLPVTDAELTED